MQDIHINEIHQDLTIIANSTKKANGYLHYYWCRCSCGNLIRLRYDQIRKKGNCGKCEDFNDSEVDLIIEEMYRKIIKG